jgi:AcrR family transcriptional regulator
LIAGGASPSVDDIAAAADVSRRTIYMYFPTLDQLLLDATVGALSAVRTAAVAGDLAGDDPVARVDALVRSVTADAEATLPLGRRIIALTVDASSAVHTKDGRRRGYRRVAWIEQALEPLRKGLRTEQFERLAAALSVVVGFEAMVVLRDVNALAPDREEEVMRWAATSLVKAMMAEAPASGPSSATGGSVGHP